MVASDDIRLIQEHAASFVVSRCLHVAAELGVADLLEDDARSAEALAEPIGADPGALFRLLRLLAAHGVFQRDGDDFRHSERSRLLRRDHPNSQRAWVRLLGSRGNWAIMGALEHPIRTGRPAVGAEGAGDTLAYLFAHLASDPHEAELFDEGMTSKAMADVANLLAAYDFAGFSRIGDIGGGRGHLLKAVLDAAPEATGVLFDLPRVIEGAAGLASERLELRAGDFFVDPLPVCDLYLLMNIIHDWGDAQAVAVLKAVRRAAPAGARLLVIETVVSDGAGPDPALVLDLGMLAVTGGRERTRGEYVALLQAAGLDLARVIETGHGPSILEVELVGPDRDPG